MSGKTRTASLVSMPSAFAKGSGKAFGTSTLTTPYSSMTNGNLTIDPSIRLIQNTGLSNINNLYNQVGQYGDTLIGNLNDTRQRYVGNQSAYMQSQMDPAQANWAQRQGQLQQSIGQRGLSGSSFGDQAMNSFTNDMNRSLADTRANAEMQNLQAVTGIDSQLASAMFGKIAQQAQLNGESMAVASQRLAQELQSLGLAQNQINTMVQAFESQQNRAFQERKAIADSIMQGFGMKSQSTSNQNAADSNTLRGMGL